MYFSKNSFLSRYQSFGNQFFPVLVSILVLTALISNDGGQPVAALLFLLSLPLLFIRWNPKSNRDNGQVKIGKDWMVTLFLPIIVSIPLFVYSGTGEALAAGARFLLAGITLIALMRVKLNPVMFLRAASASGMLTILLNVDQFEHMRVDWGAGYLGSAYIGSILMCLSFAQFYVDVKRPMWRLFALIGIACLCVIIVKTGSRGAWPAILLLFILQFTLLNISRLRKVLIAILGIVIVGSAVFAIPSVKQRVDLTMHELETYYENGNRASSMGYRLDFWRIAMNSFRESPLTGVSYQRRAEQMEEYVKNFPQSYSIGNDGRSSAHNEMLNAMAKRGLLGVIAILLLYLVPLRYFVAQIRRMPDTLNKQLAIAGGSCILVMIVCGLTEAPLMNVRVGTTFGFILICLYRMQLQINLQSASGTEYAESKID